jgi:hypothetical protein
MMMMRVDEGTVHWGRTIARLCREGKHKRNPDPTLQASGVENGSILPISTPDPWGPANWDS